MTTASAAAPNGIANAQLGSQAVAALMRDNVANTQLPINERFRSLDDYLAFLEKTQAPIDKPWYRQIRPGVYELQMGNFRQLGEKASKRVFTREELEKKFGFSR